MSIFLHVVLLVHNKQIVVIWWCDAEKGQRSGTCYCELEPFFSLVTTVSS